MSDAVTVVTGASRGIGAATARRLAADGHAVVIGYHHHQAAAASVAAAIGELGGRCVCVQADTVRDEEVARLFGAAAGLRPAHRTVNNAALTGPIGPLVDLSPPELRRVVEVNLAAWPAGPARGGRRGDRLAPRAGGVVYHRDRAPRRRRPLTGCGRSAIDPHQPAKHSQLRVPGLG